MDNLTLSYCLALSFILMLYSCAEKQKVFKECPDFTLQGSSEVLNVPAIINLPHSRRSIPNVLTGESFLFLADSNFDYSTMFSLKFLRVGKSSAENEDMDCLMGMSLSIKEPLSTSGKKMISEFSKFLLKKNIPKSIVAMIPKAINKNEEYHDLGYAEKINVSSGYILQPSRGKFFKVDIGIMDDLNQQSENRK
jgi:hypothetical protein